MGNILSKNGDIEEFVAFGGLLPLQYFNGQFLIDVLWRTIIFDIGEPNDDGHLTNQAPQTYRQAFTAWWIWQCSEWLRRNMGKKGVWAPASSIRLLCHLFEPGEETTYPTYDFKTAILHLLCTHTN